MILWAFLSVIGTLEAFIYGLITKDVTVMYYALANLVAWNAIAALECWHTFTD